MSVCLLIGIFIISFLSIILDYTNKISSKNKRIFFDLLCLLLIIISSLKNEDTCYDSASYIAYYNSLPSYFTCKDLFNSWFEPGFVLLCYIIKMLGASFHLLYLIISTVVIAIYRKIILKYTRFQFTALFVYISCYFFLNEIIIIRHGMATALVILSYSYYIENKKGKTIFLLIIATSIHSIAIIGTVPIILFIIGKNTKNKVYLCTLLCIIIGILLYLITPVQIVEFLLNNTNLLAFRMKKFLALYSCSKPGGVKRIIIYLPFIIMSINQVRVIGKNTMIEIKNKIKFSYMSAYSMICAFGCILAFSSNTDLMRASNLLLTMIIFVQPNQIEEEKSRVNKYFVMLLCILIDSYIFLRQNIFNSGNAIKLHF